MSAVLDYFEYFRARRCSTNRSVRSALDIKDRSRTSVLPWRGQFSPQLVEYLLEQIDGSVVLDPFCGSGTVLYESAAVGKDAVGIDVNPAATILASLSKFCGLSSKQRLGDFSTLSEDVLRAMGSSKSSAVGLDLCEMMPRSALNDCFLLHLFGDHKEVDRVKVERALRSFEQKLLGLPYSRSRIEVATGDSRSTALPRSSIDAVVTSPPYINVFNYHQNYRPVVEALGLSPLSAARAEIGANRKHRQNRFMTVIQYCIDMQAVFNELWAILRGGGIAIFVVGRSSKVRGVSFQNAALISAIAELCRLFNLRSKNERAFINRFGETIYEDVLVLEKIADSPHVDETCKLGREIGAQALLSAMGSADDAINEEIRDAYNRRDGIAGSPRYC